MRSSPDISVAIAVYNKEDHILSTLQSVLQQTYPAKEVVIVNDGSVDTSEQIILSIKDSRIKYIKQENKGVAAARNKAIQHCANPYIALIDADDIWHKDFLKNIVKAIEKFPDEKVFSTGLQVETASGVSHSSKYSIDKTDEIERYNYFEASSIHSLIHSSCVVLHQEVLDKVGYFDKNILSGEDTDMWIRIGLEFPIVFIPKYLATYRFIPNSLSYSTTPIKDRLQFNKFKEVEKQHPELKKFLDLNRYSLAVYAKDIGDKKNYKSLKKALDSSNLNSKQKLILASPKYLISCMRFIKNSLERLGIHTTSF